MEKDAAEKAEEFKTLGNDEFKKSNYEKAVTYYTQAIEAAGDSPKAAVYLANRAFTNIKIESYGYALEDSKKAIERDPQYVKGFYRLGSAYLSLSKLDQAKDAFLQASRLMKGKDEDIEAKLKSVKKMIFEREFAKSIMHDEPGGHLNTNWQDEAAGADYTGPRMETLEEEITPQWCEALMEHYKGQKKLHKRYLMMLLMRARKIFEQEESLVEFQFPDDVEMTVCGDTHGQFYDLLNIFKINGNPAEQTPYLFNGDFVDRGSFSVEVMVTLIAWKVCNPKAMHLTRGNHETFNMNKIYGFEGEVVAKYDSNIFKIFSDLFCTLPLVYILNKKVQVNHGGLFSKDGVKLSDIKAIDRIREPPDEGLMTDILWSDPVKMNGRHPSKRGVSIGFGPDIAKKYLDDNGLDMLIRSHEMKPEGYEEEADGRVVTIFSAPNYCDQMGNKGALIRFLGKDMKPKYTQFSAVEHPKIPPMAYSRNFLNMF
jgi:serine/threonine-protein phosphatase 5